MCRNQWVWLGIKLLSQLWYISSGSSVVGSISLAIDINGVGNCDVQDIDHSFSAEGPIRHFTSAIH